MKKSEADRRERELREQIAALQQEYHARIEPIVKELSHIEALKPPSPMPLPDGTVLTWCGPSFYDPEDEEGEPR